MSGEQLFHCNEARSKKKIKPNNIGVLLTPIFVLEPCTSVSYLLGMKYKIIK